MVDFVLKLHRKLADFELKIHQKFTSFEYKNGYISKTKNRNNDFSFASAHSASFM